MGAPKIPPKEAFERVRSLNQKREIYEGAIKEAKPFIVKIDEDVHHLIPEAVVGSSLSFGRIKNLQMPSGGSDAIGFFHVGQDRYFFNGSLNQAPRSLMIPLNADVFKLQRRKALRATVPEHSPIFFLITLVDGKMVYLETIVSDVSGGGLRIFFPHQTPGVLPLHSKIHGTLRTHTGRIIEFTGQVRHITKDPSQPEKSYFGLEIANVNGISQRMMALTLDVQRRAVLGF